MMKILVINSGSSSIKFKLFDMSDESVICKGLIEQIGANNSRAIITNELSGFKAERDLPITNHGFGIDIMNYLLFESGSLKSLGDIDAVGHRVVQGADVFNASVLINHDVLSKIESLVPLAPLHNLANLAGMRETMRVSPSTPNVAVFDTVFHQSMPKAAYMYALPLEYYNKHKLRRYGAHGTSHEFVAKEAAKLLGVDFASLNAVSLHLGSGSSVCAIKGGKCVDTSMGVTPLEGLMMGTRSGDIDPAIIPFLLKNTDLTGGEIDNILNKKSGLFAICGSNDMREIKARMDGGDEMAKLAYEMFIHRVKKYVGAYLALVEDAKCIIFTAGIGENDFRVRQSVCAGLEKLGICIDDALNESPSHLVREISTKDSPIKIIVAPTDEELAIAQETKKVVESLS